VLAGLEAIVDASGVAPRIEALLPVGVRRRQLCVRTLVVGMLVALGDGRPAHLVRLWGALCALDPADQVRLGVVADWRRGRHALTYRQVERTFGLVVDALGKEDPDGEPGALLGAIVDALVEASIGSHYKAASPDLAVDWTDLDTFSRPPSRRGGPCADPEASWGHRRGDAPGQADEVFFGYFLQLATIVAHDDGPPVPELARRMLLTSCRIDPPPAFVATLERMVASGVALGDVLADSGYAHRAPARWALRLRRLGARIVTDLHPADRGLRGTHQGALCWNGNLYCPATPRRLFDLQPMARSASPAQVAAHDATAAELAAYKLGRQSRDDADGYHRAICPAAAGKLRCPLRPASMRLGVRRPEVFDPPAPPPPCCAQVTIRVGPEVNAKTAQRHDYPSAAHRRSYARRTAVERSYATLKDPATNDISRGWCRLMGLVPLSLWAACVVVVRNLRIENAFEARRSEDERRSRAGLPPRTRRRRRRTIEDLLDSA
jgi:hypothetical protein